MKALVSYPHRTFSTLFVGLVFLTLPLSVIVAVSLLRVVDRDKTVSADENLSTDTAWDVPVLSLRYFPVIENSDPPEATGASQEATPSATIMNSEISSVPAGTTLSAFREKVNGLRDQTMQSLNSASKYHGYKNGGALPALNYTIAYEKEFLKPIPVNSSKNPDELKILKDGSGADGVSDICDYVENRGVKEVWVWMYHNSYASPIESNMAPRTGGVFGSPGFEDISNSHLSAKQDDLPRCAKTYTVYEFNYNRQVTLHNHGHQLESLFSYTEPALWKKFTDPYGESSKTNACGTVHMPPNTKAEYDYGNEATTNSNCEDWNPDLSGEVKSVNCHTWVGADCSSGGDGEITHLKQRIWWMQNIPGRGHNLSYNGSLMRNWWQLVGDFDSVAKKPTYVTRLGGGFGSNINVQGNFNVYIDNPSYAAGINRIEFYLDNGVTPFVTSNVFPHAAVLDTRTIEDGEHKIYLKVIGNGLSFGNVSVNEVAFSSKNDPSIDFNVKDKSVVGNHLLLITEVRALAGIEILNLYIDDDIRTYTQNPELIELDLSEGLHSIAADILTKDGKSFFTTVRTFLSVKDLDGDGFDDKTEHFIGTNANIKCGGNSWPPDVNNDKYVNVLDLRQIAAHVGKEGEPQYGRRYDLNANKSVDVVDLQIASSKFGTCLTAGQIPSQLTYPEISCSISPTKIGPSDGVVKISTNFPKGITNYNNRLWIVAGPIQLMKTSSAEVALGSGQLYPSGHEVYIEGFGDSRLSCGTLQVERAKCSFDKAVLSKGSSLTVTGDNVPYKSLHIITTGAGQNSQVFYKEVLSLPYVLEMPDLTPGNYRLSMKYGIQYAICGTFDFT